MGLTHQDVAGVTGSLDNLSQTLLRKRMMEQQDRQFNQEHELSRQRIGMEDARHQEDNDWRKQALQSQQSQAALKQLEDAYQQIATDYKNGVISKVQANQRGKQIVERIRGGPDLILQNSPFAAMLNDDGDMFADKPELDAAPSKTMPGWHVGPGGAMIPPQKPEPNPVQTAVAKARGVKLSERLTELDEQVAAAQASLDKFSPQVDGVFSRKATVDKSNASERLRLQQALETAQSDRDKIKGELDGLTGRAKTDAPGAAAAPKADNSAKAQADALIAAFNSTPISDPKKKAVAQAKLEQMLKGLGFTLSNTNAPTQ